MKTGQKKLLALAALFFAPLLAALALFFGPVSWYPEAVTEGVLITPARPLEAVVLTDLSGTSVSLAELQGRWTLVYPRESSCSVECVGFLEQLVQLRRALGEDSHRLSLALVADSTLFGVENLTELARKIPGLMVLLETPDQPGLLSQLEWRADLDRIYLIDALGNYLMYYPVADGPRPILEDLEHLMKHSANG